MRDLDELADVVATFEENIDEQVVYVTSDGEHFSDEQDAREYVKTVAVLEAHSAGHIGISEAKALLAAYCRKEID